LEWDRFALDTKGRFLYLAYKTSKGAGVLHYEDVILFVLAKANQRVHGRFKPMFQRYGLTPMQSLVLTALFQDEGLPAGEIGRRLVLDSATLSGVLARMEEGGWLIRSTPDGDRRVTNLHLTEKALGIRDAMLNDVEAMNREVLSVFKPEERLLLERMLKDLWR
jgi:DNA-binding MarR family transcriptional regulator